MPMICVQCSMKALIDGEALPVFEGSHEDHLRKYHPDPVKTLQERIELEKVLRLIAELSQEEKPEILH